jgi:hypothetical protein
MLTCCGGRLKLSRFTLTGFGEKAFTPEKTLASGRSVTLEIAPAE